MPMFSYMLVCTLMLMSSTSTAISFLYPVGVIEERSRPSLLVVHQTGDMHLELWQWDLTTHFAMKALPSTFIPAGVSILPDYSGFSFIDADLIRLKKLNKRSPKSFEFNKPIHHVSPIQWIDAGNGYFSAQAPHNFGIFHFNQHHEIKPLVLGAHADCMYPSKINNTLFYIERTKQRDGYEYVIKQSYYPQLACPVDHPFNMQENFKQRVDMMFHELEDPACHELEPLCSDTTPILTFGSKPIIFLSMITESLGFVIEHPRTIRKDSSTIRFVCHGLVYKDGCWSTRPIISFAIPTRLLTMVRQESEDGAGLYESLLPLLPYYHEGYLYFVDAHDGQDVPTLALFRCNLATLTQERCSQESSYSVFHPLLVGNRVYYGGEVPQVKAPGAPYINFHEHGGIYIDLPSICI